MFSTTVLFSVVLALAKASTLNERSLSGQATYYGGNTAGGACSFSTYTIPSSLFGTALSDSNWATAANCGACISVTGPSGNKITAMIVDECPGCGVNHLDLYPTAFSTLADPKLGVIDVTWDFVECGITSPLEVVSKSGVSAYWFSMQVVNANKRVASLEVSTDGGNTWKSTTRTDYNFFQQSSGFGTTIVDVKITSIDGDVVTIDNVEVSSGVSATASSNFGSSSSSTGKKEAAAVLDMASSLSTTEAPVATNPANAAAVFVEASSSSAIPASTDSIISSTKYRTTSIVRTTTLSSTTTSTSTITYYPPSSTSASNTTVTVKATKYVEAVASSVNTYPISVITISTCLPTVLYSVVTVVPTSSPIPSSGTTPTVPYAANTTLPTTSPTVSLAAFTGSAASLPGPSSIFLAAFSGLAALLFV